MKHRIGCSLLVVLLGPLTLSGEQQWTFEAEHSQDPGVHKVEDKDALDGVALWCPKTDKSYYGWYTWHVGRTFQAGSYTVLVRLKIADNTYAQPVVHVYFGTGTNSHHYQIKGTDFKKANTYQDFRLSCTTGSGNLKEGISHRLRRLPGPAMSIDRATFIQYEVFNEAEVIKRAGIPRLAGAELLPHDGIRVWFLKGLYFQHYRLQEAFAAMGAQVDSASVVRGSPNFIGVQLAEKKKPEVDPAKEILPAPAALTEIKGLGDDEDEESVIEEAEDDLEEMEDPVGVAKRREEERVRSIYRQVLGYDLLVLCNVEAANLGLLERTLIQEAVKAGSGLLVVGGPFAFGRGQWRESPLLQDLLPVRITAFRDLQPLESFTPIMATPGSSLAATLPERSALAVQWIHRTEPKEGAKVWLEAEKICAYVTHRYGRGRVGALTITVMGKAPPDHNAFWEHPDWPPVAQKLLQNLLPEGIRRTENR